jgi:hypothetical protein
VVLSPLLGVYPMIRIKKGTGVAQYWRELPIASYTDYHDASGRFDTLLIFVTGESLPVLWELDIEHHNEFDNFLQSDTA